LEDISHGRKKVERNKAKRKKKKERETEKDGCNCLKVGMDLVKVTKKKTMLSLCKTFLRIFEKKCQLILSNVETIE
jgi:hypothetical protein